MSSEKPMTVVAELTARSALDSPVGGPGRDVYQGAGLAIVEDVGLAVRSLRRSRVAADESWLQRQLMAQGLEMPARPRQLMGDLIHACAWVEPHAWLLTGEVQWEGPVPAGWLSAALGDRFCAFRLTGVRAADVLASGGNLHGVGPGTCARMPFAESAAVYVQCFSSDQYRLLVDVSLGSFLARWLADAANSILTGGEGP